jgi:multicomponent K+:H+ antiporter subunit E
MTRFIPYPVLALFLFFVWMALGSGISPGWTLLGVIVSVAGSWVMAALRLDEPSMRRPMAALRLFIAVSIDIVRSNIAVARIISRPGRPLTSGFLVIPLEMRDPTALSIMAVIITATPGTIWVSYDSRTGTLVIHILDLVDEEGWIRVIKGRYESMLMAVFE